MAGVGSAGAFWIYAAICVAGYVFIKFRLPETKGRTLEEIEAAWESVAEKPMETR